MTKTLAISVLVFVLAFALNLQAQGDRGMIRGTVLDPTGAAVPGATVTVTNTGTGADTVTSTSGSGLYNVAQLVPGTYVVSVELTGFKRAVADGVEVNVGAVVGLDFTLELGAVAESVEVTAAAPQLRTETTEVGTVLPQVVMTDLPIEVGGSGRRPISFIFLAPGASAGGAYRPEGDVRSNPGSTFYQRINGGQFGSLEQNLDGLTLHVGPGAMQSTNELSMAPEAVQEASLSSSTASAETNSGGGTAKFITKSGTNELHGNLYYFWRNDYLDASGFTNPKAPKRRWNEFGFSAGGPVIKDRLFSFVNVNWFRRSDEGGSDFLSVPTAAVKSGDLSSLLGAEVAPGIRANQLFDPATTRDDGLGGFTRDPFPGNIIPSDRISQVSKNINGFLAAPTSAGDFNNYLSTSAPKAKNLKWTTRTDFRITDRQNFYIMINYHPNPRLSLSSLPFPHGGSTRGGLNEGHFRAAWDIMITPTVTNRLSGGYNRQFESFQVLGHGDGWADTLGFPTRGPQSQAPFTGIHDGAFPDIRFSSYTQISSSGGSIDTLTKFFQDLFVFNDTLTVIRGKHNMKIGMDYRDNQTDQFSAPTNGRFQFARTETSHPAFPGQTGFDFGSYLLGDVDRAGLLDPSFTNDLSQARSSILGLFFQDDIKITPTLTMNLGLRWDAFFPMTERNDNWSILDLNLPNPGAGGRPGALIFAGQGAGRTGKSRILGADQVEYTNFAPRLGLAWKVLPNTVVRIGYGLNYFGTLIDQAGNMRRSGLGFEATPSLISPDNGLTAAFNWGVEGFPNYLRPPLIDPAFANGSRAWEFHDTHRKPYRQEWTFNIQHQLPGNWLIDLAYVANKGTRLNSGMFAQNQLNPSFLGLGPLLGRNFANDAPLLAAEGFSPPYAGFTGTLGQSLRPYPQYNIVGTVGDIGGDNFDAVGIGNSTFHSFQAKVERRLTRGLYLLSSFRWQKHITDSDSNWGAFFSPSARDHYNRQLEKALSPSDLTARFVAGFMYELPFGPGKLLGGGTTGATAKILGGWQITGIINYQSGNPLSVLAPNTVGLFTRRALPNVVPGANPVAGATSDFEIGVTSYLNRSAFDLPAPNTFGDAPSILSNGRHFSFYNENIGLIKRTNITESVNIEWRLEFFNVLNRVRFGGPAVNVANPDFGLVGGLGLQPRVGQMGLKINF